MSKVFTSSDSYSPKNQTELAESYGITRQTMYNYMRMANMIPEKELERLYGIELGSNRYEKNSHLKTQEELEE